MVDLKPDSLEKKIELLVVFQEKLAMKMNDSDFRREVLEPILVSGVTEENTGKIIQEVQNDEEISGIVNYLKEKGHSEESINRELKILLEKLIERFSKFGGQEADDLYIG